MNCSGPHKDEFFSSFLYFFPPPTKSKKIRWLYPNVLLQTDSTSAGFLTLQIQALSNFGTFHTGFISRFSIKILFMFRINPKKCMCCLRIYGSFRYNDFGKSYILLICLSIKRKKIGYHSIRKFLGRSTPQHLLVGSCQDIFNKLQPSCPGLGFPNQEREYVFLKALWYKFLLLLNSVFLCLSIKIFLHFSKDLYTVWLEHNKHNLCWLTLLTTFWLPYFYLTSFSVFIKTAL